MMTGEEAYRLIAPRVNKYLKRSSFRRQKAKKIVKLDLSSTISTFSPTTTTSISTSVSSPLFCDEKVASCDGNSTNTEISFDMKKKLEITEIKNELLTFFLSELFWDISKFLSNNSFFISVISSLF